MPRLHPDQISHTFAIYGGMPHNWGQGLHEAIELHDPAMAQYILGQNPGLKANDCHIATLISASDHETFLRKARFYPADKPLSYDVMRSHDTGAYYDLRDSRISADDFLKQQFEMFRTLRQYGANPDAASSYHLACSDKPLAATEAFSALAFHGSQNHELKAALVMEALYIRPSWAPVHELSMLFANAIGATPEEEKAVRNQLHINAAIVGLHVAERLNDTPEIAVLLSPAAQRFWCRTPDEWLALEGQMPRPTEAGRQIFAASELLLREETAAYNNKTAQLANQTQMVTDLIARARNGAKPV